MSTTVRDCMNPKVVYLQEGDRPDLALKPILDFGITAVPVVDDDHKPVGIVAIRDLVGPKRCDKWASRPATMIGIDAPVAVAARALADNDTHELVVVDGAGRAVGMLSALDVVRALLGLAAKHPRAIETFG
jgi:CBS-domain-containing membrane protein